MPVTFEEKSETSSSVDDVETAGPRPATVAAAASSSSIVSFSGDSGGGGGDGEEAFYITVENEDGEIETVQVRPGDKEQFDTNKELLSYLAEKGEMLPLPLLRELQPKKPSFPERVKRGSIIPESIMKGRRGSKEPDGVGRGGARSPKMKKGRVQLPTDHAEGSSSERAISRKKRSGSIVTPGLLEDLKANRKRIVSKSGALNIGIRSMEDQRRRFFKDIFNTAIDMQWRFVFGMFFTSFFLSWFIFAVFYWLLALYHGDLEEDNLPSGKNQEDGSFKPCVWAIEDFTSCWLFSVETQHTIGYGSRQTTEECPLAVILMCVQSVVGVIISACQAGIIFAKLARPKARAHTIQFSKNAVITLRNGYLYLLFRVGNLRKSQLIESHVRAQLIYQKQITDEGEFIHFDHHELKISSSHSHEDDRVLLHWPMTICHKFDRDSPFYRMGPREILTGKFEIIVTLEGIVESTGNSVQSRSSYLPNEILWGHRFYNIVSYSRRAGTYVVDISNLNSIQKDLSTPAKSMRDYNRELKMKKRAKKKAATSSLQWHKDEEEEKRDRGKDDSQSSGDSGSGSGSSSESD